jgi:AcrR family transcriptional regulator
MQFNEKQTQIMEAAEILFAEQGFNGTSVRDICEKAGVNLAMISYYFGSKEKLLEALFAYRGEQAKLKLESLIQREDLSAMDKIFQLIDHYIEKVMGRQAFHRILAREQVITHSPEISALILQMKKQNQSLVAQIIKEGKKKGEFKKPVDVPLLMGTLIGTASHLLTSRHIFRELDNKQDMSEAEFDAYAKKKISQHMKSIFKSLLTDD